jgi:(p)ppGpp synthase/HD superfamily hydrolase
METAADILRALKFAAEKHRDQRRKGAEKAPYVNHLIEVLYLLVQAEVSDRAVLQAAALHDTLEDTETSSQELAAAFGFETTRLVEEVTDDKSLPKQERKRLQIRDAPGLSPGAKQIKIADKISNIEAVLSAPPEHWSPQRQIEYLEWTEQVVNGCRGVNAKLERRYDTVLEQGRATLRGKANYSE